MNTRGDLKAFILDVLDLFTTLERVELPNHIWKHPDVLQAIHSHPTLLTCKFPDAQLRAAPIPQVDLRKIIFRKCVLQSDAQTSILKQLLAAGVMIEELRLHCSSTSWTRLRFPTNLTSIRIIITLDDMDSFWESVSIHPAVRKVSVKQATSSLKSSNSYWLLRKIAPEALQVLEEGLSCFIGSTAIKKEKGTWWLKNVVMSIECGEGLVEGFCSKVQQLGNEFHGLESLVLTPTKWDRNRGPEDPSIEVSSAASCIYIIYIIYIYIYIYIIYIRKDKGLLFHVVLVTHT